jgi:hypothetical protein
MKKRNRTRTGWFIFPPPISNIFAFLRKACYKEKKEFSNGANNDDSIRG